jgi:Zn-dependent metalloprotease
MAEPVKGRTPAAKRGAKAAKSRSVRASATRTENGLQGFALHVQEPTGRKALARLTQERSAFPGFAAARGRVKTLDAETAATLYLDQALASDAVKRFTRPKVDSEESEFKSLGTEVVPLTGTTAVKFRQMFNKIPVYGSLVTVELDRNNECIGINSSLGTPQRVPHIAKVAPAKAIATAAKAAGRPASALKQTPRLYYYFGRDSGKWHLAYIIEDVPQLKPGASSSGRHDAVLKDYVIDANSGRLLAQLPRTPTLAARVQIAVDGLQRKRKITVETGARGGKELRDKALNVTTYGFDFKDPSRQSRLLPGTLYGNPPKPWPLEAVAAHANGSEVARFLRKVLRRNNIDNKGGEMISSVNCWDRGDGVTPARQWQNAYWNGDQMVYGQILFPDGSFFSIANMLDVVAHEMFHGVTDYTSRLEYVTQSGALNESYSDIFGVIVANLRKPLAKWNWKLGEGFDGPGTALRDMQDPTRHEQPKRMRNYKKSKAPYTYERNDYGWVHDNSGIHNFAAYSIMTSMSGGKYLFRPIHLAAMFYIALTVHLSRTSQFADSRRAVVQAARSLFRNEPAARRDAKIKAVENGFSAAGIR